MKALVQVERWLGISVMIILPSAGTLWLIWWIFDSPERQKGAAALVGVIALIGFLYWRLKNLNIENRG